MEIAMYLFVTGTLAVLITSLCKARAQAQSSMATAMEKQRELEAEIRQRMATEAALRKSEALLEQRVKERTAELQEMVDELRHFAYAIIHDMRSPLRSMRGFADLVEEDSGGALPSPCREYLRRIRAACGRMDRLIQDSLNYNNAILKSLPLQPVDLSKLVRELCATYSNLRPYQAGIRVEGLLPMVLGNDAALTQCFSILLGNAVKFVAAGVEPKIRVWADQHDNKATISVRDNGIGIPAATQSHLFGIFQRHDSIHEGNGIGLAIVRKLARRMGGKVGVESEKGKGSRFWLELKLAPSWQNSAEPSNAVAAERMHHAQIKSEGIAH
jgi:signal transduction histidine kinase